MTSLDVLGLSASFFTTSSFIPQMWQVWKTKDVSGISLPTYMIITFGLILWLIYGILKQDLPITVANSIMVFLTGGIALMKIKFEKRKS
jgi:MtN3 and saliva related transmembrane protein